MDCTLLGFIILLKGWELCVIGVVKSSPSWGEDHFLRNTIRDIAGRPCLKIELKIKQLICCSSYNHYDDNDHNDSKDHQEQTQLHIK